MSVLPGWTLVHTEGWYEQSAGIAAIYLSGDIQGFLSATTDTPANTSFLARIKNADEFYIEQAFKTWVEGDSASSATFSSYARLEIDNSRGEFTYLIGADCRDAIVVLQIPFASATGVLATAPVVATAALDSVEAPDPSTIVLVLRDILATYDRPMQTRKVHPYADAGAVGKMIPMTFGSVRNIEPLLIDSPNRLYLLHDGVISNITAVRDKGGKLDPYADIPQYTSALDGTGLQLAVLPQGKLTVDCSSVGDQTVIPGTPDVLGGIGAFTAWTTSTNPPNGWSWTAGVGSVLTRGAHPPYAQNYVAIMQSAKPWYPFGGKYGDSLSVTAGTPLKSGKAYRISFQLQKTFYSPPGIVSGLTGGVMIRSALDNLPASAISPHGLAIQSPLFGNYSYSFSYRCPVGADRDIYLIAVASDSAVAGVGVGLGGGIIYNVVIEELGQFLDLPQDGITLNRYFYEILPARVGSIGSWVTTDLTALDAATGYKVGVHYTDSPKIIDALRVFCPSFCAQVFVDAVGMIRMRRLVAPEDATIVAAFDNTCVNRKTIVIEPFIANGLTTQIGVRRNCSPIDLADDISDTDLLTADERVRYSQPSQYYRKSTINVAEAYQFANNAAPLESLLDDVDDGQTEINRVCSIFAPRIYNGALSTGERFLCTFEVTYDDFTLGIGPSVAPQNLLWGDGITLTSPLDGFNATPMIVLGKRFYPYARRMVITGMY